MIEKSEGWQIARDRVLLYVRAMDLPPFQGLELALQALKESNASSIDESMNALERCILSKELQAEILDEEGKHIASIPPMNRGTMVSKNFDRIPWLTATKKFMRRWMRDLFGPSRTR